MIHKLPENLKYMREKLDLSQEYVANRLGISTSCVSSYETGHRTPSVERLLALSYLYGCSTDYLLGKGRPELRMTVDVSDLTGEQIGAIQVIINSIKWKNMENS